MKTIKEGSKKKPIVKSKMKNPILEIELKMDPKSMFSKKLCLLP